MSTFLFVVEKSGDPNIQYKNISQRRRRYLDDFYTTLVDSRYVYGILLPKLFLPTARKNCSRDREKLLKFEAEGREFAKNLRSLEQFIQTVKGQNNFW